MANAAKVALVTGSNKGIGLATVRNLALQYAALSRRDPLVIYMSARNPTLGETSLKQLHEELKPKNVLVGEGGNVELRFLKLDLVDEVTVESAKGRLVEEHGGLDILINNAAIATKGPAFDSEVVRTTLATNFYGTLMVINKLFPIIRPHGRMVNVSSSSGRLSILSEHLQKQFTKEDLTIDGLIDLMKKFQEDVDKGIWTQQGWPTQGYGVSKVGVTAMTKIFARRTDAEGKHVLVHACDPGWVRTDMAGPRAALTPDQGAETPVFIALDEVVVPHTSSGEFWKNCKVTKW